MKAVKNVPVKPIKKGSRSTEREYWCKTCGARNSGVAHYSETVLGTATLLNLDGEFDEYIQNGDEDFEVDRYACGLCNEEDVCIENLFTGDPPHVEDEEDEDETS